MELLYVFGYFVIGSIMSGLFIRWSGDHDDPEFGVRIGISFVWPIMILFFFLFGLSFLASGDLKKWSDTWKS